MSLSEFQLIEKYFTSPFTGDDGAVVQIPAGMSRVGVCETITAQSPNINTDHPKALGHRVLSTALNALAALGATPAWMTLSLTLPEARDSWLQPFSDGLLTLAQRFGVSLIGGDTTQGPVTITVMLDGLVGVGTELRAIPEAGDVICLSGPIASAANALIATSTPHLFSDQERRHALMGLEYPEPRVELGKVLREFSVATADLSRGLTNGIETLLHGCQLGAQVKLDSLPVPTIVKNQMALAPAYRPWLSLSGDHELVFSVSPTRQKILLEQLEPLELAACVVGKVDTLPGVRLVESG